MHVRSATTDDAAAIADIYNQGIEDRRLSQPPNLPERPPTFGVAATH